MPEKPAVAVIGCGAMGGAIARGLVAKERVEPTDLVLVDADAKKAADLAAELGARSVASADLGGATADVVLLAVKPQVLAAVCKEIAPVFRGRLVISIAAGVNLASLAKLAPGAAGIVRAMPNLALTAGSGATALASQSATSEQRSLARELFDAFGPAEFFTEGQLDAMGAISGAEPAYVALFVDALTRAAIEQGLPAATARRFILSTMIGTAKILEEGEHPRAFMEEVMSPGGTTVRAVAAMDPAFTKATHEGVRAAVARTRELAEGGA